MFVFVKVTTKKEEEEEEEEDEYLNFNQT